MNNKYNNIDDLLKDTLQDYGKKPSSGVWQKITWRLWLLEKGIYILIPLLILISISAYFIFSNNDPEVTYIETFTQSDKDSLQNKFIQTTKETNINSEKYNNKTQENKTTLIEETKINNQSITQKQIEPKGTNENSLEQITIREAIIEKAETKSINSKQSGSAESENTMLKNNDFAEKTYKRHFSSSSTQMSISDNNKLLRLDPIVPSSFILKPSFLWKQKTIHYRYFENFIPYQNKSKNKKAGQWSYGIHIIPELIFTNNDNNDKKQSIGLDFTGIYRIKNFYLQLGAGIGLSNDKGKFNIDYSQYDSIGYYYEVTGFSVNQQTGQPDFKTEIENVYDTVYYNQNEKTDNLYTYLRLPVYAGINLHNSNRMTLSIKAGGIYSVLLNSREASHSFTNENATWINVVDESHKRVQNNFQISIGVAAAFHVRGNLSLSIEPLYNYYIKNIYVNGISTKTPWSVSLRTGLIFKF